MRERDRDQSRRDQQYEPHCGTHVEPRTLYRSYGAATSACRKVLQRILDVQGELRDSRAKFERALYIAVELFPLPDFGVRVSFWVDFVFKHAGCGVESR